TRLCLGVSSASPAAGGFHSGSPSFRRPAALWTRAAGDRAGLPWPAGADAGHWALRRASHAGAQTVERQVETRPGSSIPPRRLDHPAHGLVSAQRVLAQLYLSAARVTSKMKRPAPNAIVARLVDSYARIVLGTEKVALGLTWSQPLESQAPKESHGRPFTSAV